MLDFAIVKWTVILAVLAVLGGILYRLLAMPPKGRLMRCPETGSITFVDVESVSRGERTEPELRVQHCELWPAKKDCSQGCLVRYGETGPGFRVRPHALRPFEQQ
jgi:hypothetical protein